MKTSTAFTLIELMLVIVIIGIITTVAMPSYQEYAYNSKLAEGYTNIGAATKAQIAYFHDNRFFIGGFYLSSEPGAVVAPATGTKGLLTVGGTGGDDAWRALGSPISGANPNFFGYRMEGIQFDGSSSMFRYFNGGFVATATSLNFGGFKVQGTPATACANSNINLSTLGISTAANRNIAVTSATADLKKNPTATAACSYLVQYIISDSGDVYSSPMVTIRE